MAQPVARLVKIKTTKVFFSQFTVILTGDFLIKGRGYQQLHHGFRYGPKAPRHSSYVILYLFHGFYLPQTVADLFLQRRKVFNVYHVHNLSIAPIR